VTLTPENDDPHPVSPIEAKSTRELVIRLSYFTVFTVLLVGASIGLAYVNPKLGAALAVGATILAAIYAVQAYTRNKRI
jgi:hypothetical protein